jgi:hypothetical protein
MSAPSHMKAVENLVDKDIVNALTDALTDAKAGKFVGLAIVGLHRDGGSMSWRNGPADRLVYALSFFVHRILNHEERDVETLK